jgi:hypothetical protein
LVAILLSHDHIQLPRRMPDIPQAKPGPLLLAEGSWSNSRSIVTRHAQSACPTGTRAKTKQP